MEDLFLFHGCFKIFAELTTVDGFTSELSHRETNQSNKLLAIVKASSAPLKARLTIDNICTKLAMYQLQPESEIPTNFNVPRT